MGALGEPDGDLLGLSVGVPCSGGGQVVVLVD